MFGPPCHRCGSENDWLPGLDGEECKCGWPFETISPQDWSLLELVDGAYNIVELFKPQSPTQEAWRKNWLNSAKKSLTT